MFEERKRYFLERLEKEKKEGRVDEDIIEILDFINNLDNYFTTSSCSGRIILLKVGKTKKDTEFLFKKHSPVSFEEVWKVLIEKAPLYKEEIWFKVDPVILHVDCKDIESARKMLEIALKSGWKRSGLMVIKDDRYLLELESTERVETIVAENGKVLVDEEYMRILVEKANKRLLKTKEKLKRFYENLKQGFQK